MFGTDTNSGRSDVTQVSKFYDYFMEKFKRALIKRCFAMYRLLKFDDGSNVSRLCLVKLMLMTAKKK